MFNVSLCQIHLHLWFSWGCENENPEGGVDKVGKNSDCEVSAAEEPVTDDLEADLKPTQETTGEHSDIASLGVGTIIRNTFILTLSNFL